MVNVKVSRIIKGESEKIWDFINQVERFPDWMPGVVAAKTKGPIKSGIGRQQILKTSTELGDGETLQEVVVWEPPTKITWQHLHDVMNGKNFSQAKEIKTTLSITNINGHVTFRMIGSWQPDGISGKLLNRIMKRTVTKNFEQALLNLEQLLKQAAVESA